MPPQDPVWGSNVPIYDANMKLRAVPQDPGMVQAALGQEGNQRAIPMLDQSSGKHYWVPEAQLHDALDAGHVISFPEQQVPSWFGFTPGNMLSNAWHGAKSLAGGLYSLGADLASNPNWFEGSGSTYNKFVGQPSEQQTIEAGKALEAGHPIVAVGHALASGVPLVGPWAASLGEQAGSGDVGGATGQVIGALGAAKAPGLALRGVNAVLPSLVRAQAGLSRVASGPGQTVTPDITDITKTINGVDAHTQQYGGPPLPDTVKALQGRAIASGSPTLGQPAPTFAELYEHLKAINKSLYVDRSVPKSLDPAVKTIAQQLADTLSDATQQMPRGYSQLWEDSLGEYRNAMKITRVANTVGPLVGGAVGFGLGRGIGKSIGAPLTGELATGYLGRMVGKPLAGSIAESIVGRDMPTPPNAPLPQGAMYTIGQQVGKLRNFMTGGGSTPSAPSPAGVTPPPAPPAPPGAAPAAVPPVAAAPVPAATAAPSTFGQGPSTLTTGPLPARFQPIIPNAPPAPPTAVAPVAAPPEATGAPPEPPSGPPGGVERRGDATARAKFAAMTPEQQYQAAYTNHVTGLPNVRAFAEAPPSGAYGFSDVAGLKFLNDTHGMDAGNALLRAKAQALQEANLDAYHTGGDEFQVRGTDPATLDRQLAQANENLKNKVIEFKGPNGEIERYSGAEFRHGTGTTPAEAQAGMMAKKAASTATRGKPGTLVRMPAPPPAPME